MNEWIKIENGLPPEDLEVLACNDVTIYFARLDNNRFVDADEYWELIDITHWMRLPKRPNE